MVARCEGEGAGGGRGPATDQRPAKRLRYNYLHKNMQIVDQGSPERNSRVLFTVSRSLCIALSDFRLLLFNT